MEPLSQAVDGGVLLLAPGTITAQGRKYGLSSFMLLVVSETDQSRPVCVSLDRDAAAAVGARLVQWAAEG